MLPTRTLTTLAAKASGVDANNLQGLTLESNKPTAKTAKAVVPGPVQRLTAQLARDTSEVGGIGKQGVLLLWNPPADPAGAPVTHYQVELSSNDGDFEYETRLHRSNVTHWVDKDEPAADEKRVYRITPVNAVDPAEDDDRVTVMIPYPADGHPHTVPATISPDPTAAAGSTAGTVVLTWDGVSTAERYFVFGFKVADLETARAQNNFAGLDYVFEAAVVADMADPSHTVDMHRDGTALDSEDYYFTVNTGNSAGWGGWSNWFIGAPN